MAMMNRDIARKMNLSVGAVSRALNGYSGASAGTRQLRKQMSSTTGYIRPVHAPRFKASFFSAWIEDRRDETARQGDDLLISALEAPRGCGTPQCITEGALTIAGGHLATKRLLSIPDPPDTIGLIRLLLAPCELYR